MTQLEAGKGGEPELQHLQTGTIVPVFVIPFKIAEIGQGGENSEYGGIAQAAGSYDVGKRHCITSAPEVSNIDVLRKR